MFTVDLLPKNTYIMKCNKYIESFWIVRFNALEKNSMKDSIEIHDIKTDQLMLLVSQLNQYAKACSFKFNIYWSSH